MGFSKLYVAEGDRFPSWELGIPSETLRVGQNLDAALAFGTHPQPLQGGEFTPSLQKTHSC
jgi:hypothetical protein